jgi:large-conductance mechanosensitive channel
MSEKDEQTAENAGAADQPPQRVWAITFDPKVAEYKEQINATGVHFQRIAGAIIGFMLLLLFGFILPVASSKNVAKLSELRSHQSKLEQEIKKSEVETELLEERRDLLKGAVLAQAPKRGLDTERARIARR